MHVTSWTTGQTGADGVSSSSPRRNRAHQAFQALKLADQLTASPSAPITYSDGEGLQSFSIHAVGVGAQQLPSLLALIVQTLKTETIQS